jgi:hypothetical protein
MKRRVSDKVRELKTNEAALVVKEIHAARQGDAAINATLLLGASGALDATARLTASQSVRALQRFRDSKGHESLGFTNFKDFLNKSPYSPMSYDQFNDREKLLETEGDVVFNLLSTMRVPAVARKQLATGSIQIEGEEIAIAGTRIHLDDHPRIKEIIKTLADKTIEQAKKIEKGQAEVKKLKKDVDEARRSTARRPDSPALDQALMDVLLAMGRYADEVSKLTLEEVAETRDEAMRLISEQWQRLRVAQRFPDAPVAHNNGNGHLATSGLSSSDLDDLEDVL